MNYSKINLGSIFIIVLLLVTGCGSSGNMYNIEDEDLTLRTHLTRHRYTEFSGSRVFIKDSSIGSFSGVRTEPLFIINGNEAGHSLINAENIISGRTIKSVEVYKPSQSGRWGESGAHGVVIVKTTGATDS